MDQPVNQVIFTGESVNGNIIQKTFVTRGRRDMRARSQCIRLAVAGRRLLLYFIIFVNLALLALSTGASFACACANVCFFQTSSSLCLMHARALHPRQHQLVGIRGPRQTRLITFPSLTCLNTVNCPHTLNQKSKLEYMACYFIIRVVHLPCKIETRS